MTETARHTPDAHGQNGPSPYDRPALVAAARQSIRKGSKSFATASRLFDRTTRERVWLLYAWCRACDDIADDQDSGYSAHTPARRHHVVERLALMAQSGQFSSHLPTLRPTIPPEARLATIRTLSELAMAGESTGSPAFDALGQLMLETGITPVMVEDVIAGFALDAADWRPRSETDMMRYCYHVAGAVGVMMAAVMGVQPDDDDTLDRACDLGLAFQLANIVRDICDDHANDRCYLPVEWMAEADIPAGEVTKPHYRQSLVSMVQRACALARDYEASARIGAARLTFRQRWAVLSAAGIYGGIAREVERLGAHAWDHRVHIPKQRKLALVLQALWQARPGRRLPQNAPKPALSRQALSEHARLHPVPVQKA